MIVKINKHLESAKRFVLKGQIERAIKDYEQVVALDSNDMRHRQRLAELLSRANRKDDAVKEYEYIGKHYTDATYYLKAIAIYKQIQKLTPNEFEASLTLASLNEKQGLIGNAIAEYQVISIAYEKSDKPKELLTILEKILAIDPQNHITLLKLSETYYTLGKLEESYEKFTDLVLLLQKKKNKAELDRIYDRIQQLFPEKNKFILDLLVAQIDAREAPEAILHLQEIIKNDNTNLEAWHILIHAYQTLHDKENLKLTFQQMYCIFPDDPASCEMIIRYTLDEGDANKAAELLESYAPQIISTGNTESTEQLYLALLELTPDDTNALNALANFYEATSAPAKLAEIRTKLDDLSTGINSLPKSLTQTEDISISSVNPLIDTSEQPEETSDWEEDIDLTQVEETAPLEILSTDAHVTEMGVTSIIPKDKTPDSETANAQATNECTIPMDKTNLQLDVELDDELLGTDWLNETPEGSASTGGEPIKEDTLPAANVLSTIDSGLPVYTDSDSLDFSEETPSEGLDQTSLAAIPHVKHTSNGLVTKFNKGLQQQVDDGDTETHYNLGIAYMEMGLMDEAINEFQAAAVDPNRKSDCLTLQGVCCRHKGDMDTAEQILKDVINADDIQFEGLISTKYELALLYEETGHKDKAIQTYLDIQTAKPCFRDTQQKLVELLGKEAVIKLEEIELLD